MRYVRAGFRIVCLVTGYTAFASAGAVWHVLCFRRRRALLRGLCFLTHHLGRFSCFIFNIRIEVAGEVNPVPGTLIIANHVGSPDVFVLGACFKTFFVSKQDFRNWPLLGGLFRLGATIFVDRARRRKILDLNREVRERLDAGFSVTLFPEGGVSGGTDVQPFKSSPFESAIAGGRPVLPVALRYHDGRTPSIACWYGIGFMRHILDLLQSPRLDVTVTVLPEIRAAKDRHALAETCRRLIRDAFHRRLEARP